MHVKLLLRGGAFREDVSYGLAQKQKSRGAACDLGYKGATTDGIKRCARQLGRLFSCVYDDAFKEFCLSQEWGAVTTNPDRFFLLPWTKVDINVNTEPSSKRQKRPIVFNQ